MRVDYAILQRLQQQNKIRICCRADGQTEQADRQTDKHKIYKVTIKPDSHAARARLIEMIISTT